MSGLQFSILASIVLTVVLNVGLRAFPGIGRRTGEWIERQTRPTTTSTNSPQYETHTEPAPSPRVRVFFPWKLMLIGSIGLTVLLNLVARL